MKRTLIGNGSTPEFPELTIPFEKVCCILSMARQFDAKDAISRSTIADGFEFQDESTVVLVTDFTSEKNRTTVSTAISGMIVFSCLPR